jgi:TonB family protein
MSFHPSRITLGFLLLALPFSALAQRPAAKTAPKPTTTPAPAQAQAAPQKQDITLDWETLHPENEDFSILMPKDTKTEIGPFDYHKFQLNTRLYMSAPTTGPVVGVVSMSGIKSNPASASDLERFNSYADAFKQFFAPKVRKDVPPKMSLTTSKLFHGYTARIYRLTVGDLSGVVNAVVTKKRFYAVALLNTKKDDALEDKFVSSFVIPDKPIDQPNTAAAEETQGQSEVASTNPQEKPKLEGRRNGISAEGGGNGASVQGTANTEETTIDAGTGNVQPTQPAQKRAPISGGMLNGKAIYLPLPEMPAGEKATGVVMVQILVDEQGTVVDAKAVSGPPGLHAAAVNAARFARFSPTMLMGELVRVQGTLAYNFAKAN